jgi:hypothetical protein
VRKLVRISLISVILGLGACAAATPKLTKQAAIDLLDQGKVAEIGVSHSGWTILTLTDGTYASNKAEEIGYPEELLKICKNCSDVSQWIE